MLCYEGAIAVPKRDHTTQFTSSSVTHAVYITQPFISILYLESDWVSRLSVYLFRICQLYHEHTCNS